MSKLKPVTYIPGPGSGERIALVKEGTKYLTVLYLNGEVKRSVPKSERRYMDDYTDRSLAYIKKTVRRLARDNNRYTKSIKSLLR